MNMKNTSKYDIPVSKEKKEYFSKNIKKLYKKPSALYFLPFVGFIIYMKDSMKYGEEAGLLDVKTPGGKIMDDFTKKFMLSLSILLPIWTFLVMLLFNFSFPIWARVAKKAIKANENALIYKDFGSL